MSIAKLIIGVAAAGVLAANQATYALSNGQTLEYQVDQDLPVTTTFLTADFVSIGAATANEVCAVLNRDFAAQGLKATATVVNNAVQIASNNDGQVLILGGTAAATFAFAAFSTQTPEGGDMPSAPLYATQAKFVGDSSYPTNGYTGFAALLKAATGRTPTILAVIAQDCGGYLVNYDVVRDAVKIWKGNGTNPGQEVTNGANLSAVTFNVLIIWK